jgi:hypothetical protein
MQSFSENKQDIFVSSLLPINNGFYIDIGSYNPITNNNTYLLEQLGWNGICIEIDSSFNEEYKQRNCIFLNQDALNINYKNLFKEHNVPNINLFKDYFYRVKVINYYLEMFMQKRVLMNGESKELTKTGG